MLNEKITIERLGDVGKDRAATEAAERAIYVEKGYDETAYCITVRGEYDGTFYFVTGLSGINEERVLADGDKLIVCLSSDIVVLDLQTGKILKTIAVTQYVDMFAIYKFKDGYFVHGQMVNRYFDNKFALQWEYGGKDIFYCPNRESSLEICDDHIDVWDFEGNKYTYDEYGETNTFLRSFFKKKD